MEWDVVLCHELVEADAVVFRLPPEFVVLGVPLRDTDVTDGGVEPDVEYLVSVSVDRHWDSPLQIAGYTTRLETVAQPWFSHDSGGRRPLAFDTFGPFFKVRFYLKS